MYTILTHVNTVSTMTDVFMYASSWIIFCKIGKQVNCDFLFTWAYPWGFNQSLKNHTIYESWLYGFLNVMILCNLGRATSIYSGE